MNLQAQSLNPALSLVGIFRDLLEGGGVTVAWRSVNIGALTIRIGFWGPLYYNYKKEPSKEYW